ncbi:MAG: guanine deaminase [Thermoanaerobaculia bacterium]|nr:guanine deaminase [Thermoanaerobaculia bacterium]
MQLVRGRVFTPVRDPFVEGIESSYTYLEDGYLAIDGSKIVGIGEWNERPESDEVADLSGDHLIVPGFVDTHLHAPQLEMIGSYGGHLLEWLNRYTFPTECRFADPEHARRVAKLLFDQLLRNGTTTALLFSTIHAEATVALFEEAKAVGYRAIIGKTMMDQNAPPELLEDPERSYRESREILEVWHGAEDQLLHYAVTPRFAPTSTPDLLEVAGRLVDEFPNVWVHSHVSENEAELEWVAELFPDARDYASVYEAFGLLTGRTVLAHGVHLSAAELELLEERGTALSHCPNSNLFLGSGLFPMRRIVDAGIRFGLGTDIGAGTTPSIVSAMADAYKIQQVLNVSLSPFHLWYLATLGGARALALDEVTGSLERGKDADFLVIDTRATPLLTLRTRRAESLEDLLAGCIFLGDDRLVAKVWIRGREVWSRGRGDASAVRAIPSSM